MKKEVLVFVVNVDWFFISHRLPIALAAISEGYDVHLITNDTGGGDDLRKLGIQVHHVPFSRSGNKIIGELRSIISLRKLLKDISPNIIHSVTIKAVIYSGLCLHTFNQKPAFVAAISGLGYVFSAKNLRALITKLLASFLYRLAFRHQLKKVIFQNTTDEKVLSTVTKLAACQKVMIKGSGADLELYNYCLEPETEKLKVVMACRLLKEKGVYEYIKAAEKVGATHNNVEFLLAGAPDDGNPNSISKKELENWAEKGVITLLGHCTNISEVFSDSHIVTLPSYYGEGVPKVLIEAAACGRPIITTNNPGCRDTVIDHETGILIPIRDANALANALTKLIDDKELRLRMGIRAREYAVSEFDINSVISEHLKIYKELTHS